MTTGTAIHCPVTIGINIDVESMDAQNAGRGGLFGRHSYGRYGAREGIWRLLTEFRQNAVLATFFIVPEDAQRHPHVVEAILEEGHELAVRGRVRDKPDGPEDLSSLQQDLDALYQLTGVRPQGWRAANGLLTERTLPALAALGFTYDSSAEDDDTPYVMSDANNNTLVELPTFSYLTDSFFYTHRHTHARVAKAWREEADAQYCAGGYINLTLHTRGDTGSSRLPRVAMVGEFIRMIAARPGVKFYRAIDLANEWKLANALCEPFPSFRRPQIHSA